MRAVSGLINTILDSALADGDGDPCADHAIRVLYAATNPVDGSLDGAMFTLAALRVTQALIAAGADIAGCDRARVVARARLYAGMEQ